MVERKEICAFFYEHLGAGSYKRKECGIPRKQQIGSSYSNLMSHIATKHPHYEDVRCGYWWWRAREFWLRVEGDEPSLPLVTMDHRAQSAHH
ncbi:hypothetical protein F444_14941 [Phytophthora nicotianae P1976]|uniref:BED-type domain-containing protein n=1 Tax=Phytophthora nicotianae P1976 TaxID=1317066 RepID=A0A080ZNJ7_PHYNI|nr:hypothetical protein F444_14941 [Phytophthora nicotianae P1976]